MLNIWSLKSNKLSFNEIKSKIGVSGSAPYLRISLSGIRNGNNNNNGTNSMEALKKRKHLSVLYALDA